MKRINWIGILLLLLAATSLHAQETEDVESIIDSMSLEHKVGQMFMVTLHGSALTEVGAEHLRRWQPGGVVLFGENGVAQGLAQGKLVVDRGERQLLDGIDLDEAAANGVPPSHLHLVA